ncbi:MAG: LysR family transcriptional regulator [Burkholderiales bacterium]|nr:LysR family transcriptional regulator [Burkholderiales bacterium]
MNLQSDDIALFVRVAALGTLSAAARERNVAVSQVTRVLARLEAECGVRLMHRNTHGLSLTDEGDAFLATARRWLDIQAELQTDLSGKLGGPVGWVRLSVSSVLAQAVIAPGLDALYRRHPGLQLDICADDRVVDMAREGVDVAIRTGTPQRDTVVARQIGQLTRGLYASPGYIAAHGLPRTADDLRQHRLLTNSLHPSLNAWEHRAQRGNAVFEASGHTRADSTAALVALVQCGVGIARVVDRVARPLVASGALVPVLPELFASPPVPMYAVMLRERHRLPKVRACVEFWAEWMNAG